jgi:hypothetical protein
VCRVLAGNHGEHHVEMDCESRWKELGQQSGQRRLRNGRPANERDETNVSIASTLTESSDAAKSDEFILHIISVYFSHTA